MRSPRTLKLLAGIVAGSLAAALAIVSPAYASISGLSATNDATNVTYQFNYTGAPPFARTYVDTDRNSATGFAQAGIGADYLLEDNSVYHHNGGGWSWTLVKTVIYSATGGVARWTVARADIGETASPNDADLIFQVERPLETSGKYTHVYSGGGGSPGRR